MKILFDHQIFSIQKYGGISRYFYEVANGIAKMSDNKVEIFAPLYLTEYFLNNPGVHPRGIKTPTLSKIKRIVSAVNYELAQILVKRRHDIDIFHETYYSMAGYCPASAKSVVTVYDMIHEKFSEYFPVYDLTQQKKAHAVSRADHVICISENTKCDLIDLLSVPEEKISVVYMGCSLKPRAEKKISIPGVFQKPYILYVGIRLGYKNFERLLRAYANSSFLRNEFILVCFGGGAFSTRELTLMKSLGIPIKNLRYLDGTDEVLAELYISARAFVYPSLYEGFGIPPLEAMSFSCPVVSANTGSLPEVVGDAAELFDPYDVEGIGAAIERVVSTPMYADLLVKKGLRRINLFSWGKCAKDTLNVYHKILEV